MLIESDSNIDKLLPANLDELLEKYQSILNLSTSLTSIKRTPRRLEATIPLLEHPVHGITGLHVIEKYDNDGYVKQYHYHWKVIIPKQGIQESHISGWGNDPHNNPNTPDKYRVKTEPHHHHHIPRDRKRRKENYHVRTLEKVLEFVSRYITTGLEYVGVEEEIIR